LIYRKGEGESPATRGAETSAGRRESRLDGYARRKDFHVLCDSLRCFLRTTRSDAVAIQEQHAPATLNLSRRSQKFALLGS